MTIQLKATLHYFPECDTLRYAVQGGPGFVDEMIFSNESYYEQYFSVVLFIMLTYWFYLLSVWMKSLCVMIRIRIQMRALQNFTFLCFSFLLVFSVKMFVTFELIDADTVCGDVLCVLFYP